MKERLLMLLDLEQLTPSKFADLIGVQRSSVSHVLSGRNNPSFDFLQKTLKAFPGMNADWLILGEGNMYEKTGRNASADLFDQGPSETSGKDTSGDGRQASGQTADLFSGIDEAENLKTDEEKTGGAKTDEGKAKQEHEREFPKKERAGTDSQHALKKEPKVIQVLIFYDDDTFRSYNPAE